jgi:regulator of cell morphogenesis and NO signaling
MIQLENKTLATLVSENHQTAGVLEKYNLDFCCKGKRTLKDACNEKGLSYDEIVAELDALQLSGIPKHLPFTEMSAEQLINHILLYHHFYVKQALPRIFQHVQKVASKHGGKFTWMVRCSRILLQFRKR